MAVERIARLVEGDVLRQRHRQILFRHRHGAALLAVDDRDRAAPIALARNAPVAQAVIDLALRHRAVAARFFLEPLGDVVECFGGTHAVEKARIDHCAVAVIGDVGDDEGLRVLPGRADHRRIAEAVFVDEVQVALVVRRAAEDGAGAVLHQNEIGDIDRQLPVRIERMHGLDAGVEAHLLGGVDRRLRGAHLLGLGDEGGEFRILRRGGRGQRMIGRQRHELGAEQSVRPRGEDFQLALFVRRGRRIEHEANQQAFRAADPVLLHQPDFFRPAVERVERVEQILGIIADLEEPLRQLALLDHCARAPAAAVDHLLVGEHGVVDRVPVHFRLLALDQAGAQEIEKHLLLVLVIGRIAGGDLARPVEGEPHGLELLLHRRDVVVGPGLRVHLAVDGGVLRRHAESVPAHRVQHGVAHGAFEASHHVAHGVVAHVAHVDAPRRVGEHLQHVVFGSGVVVLGGEDAAARPTSSASGPRPRGRCSGRFSANSAVICGSFRTRGTDTKGLSRSTGPAQIRQ